ncbi:MAG: hypothetical protein ACTSWM_06105, partial [Alphaproteobacteria bacterium]
SDGRRFFLHRTAAILLASVVLSACGTSKDWTYTPVTMSDGSVAQVRTSTVDFDDDGPDFSDIVEHVQMPDGTWIGCSGPDGCKGAYDRNKDRYTRRESEGEGGGGGGGHAD